METLPARSKKRTALVIQAAAKREHESSHPVNGVPSRVVSDTSGISIGIGIRSIISIP
jgi:hypothetical protein